MTYSGKSIILFIFSCICILTLLFSSCENDEKVLQERVKKKIGVDEAKNVQLFYSQSGKVKSKLTAPVMYRYQDTLPRVEFPQSLHIDFYNDSLQIESVVDAKYGRYIEGQNKAFLKDSVVAIQKISQDTVRCKELWWEQNKQIFYTDKPALITKKDGTILPAEKGFTATQDFKTITLRNPTNGQIPMPENITNGTDSTARPKDSTANSQDSTKK
ncbi:MAG: LPS export ABC transporter periplasmic protein LptC [Agriterribacter sp.]